MTGTIRGGDTRGPHRLQHMRHELKNLLESVLPTHVAYEDYALNKRKGNIAHVHTSAELGGVFKSLIWEMGIHLIMVPPTVLKLVITGSGQGGGDEGKEKMKAALRDDFGFIIPQADEADACGLMLVGEMKCGANALIPDVRKSDRTKSIGKCELVRGKLKLISNGRTN